MAEVMDDEIGVVVIGRNEGERLVRCLASLNTNLGGAPFVVYVDSGSTDNSVAAARAAGAAVVEISPLPVFTAARARNAGVARVLAERPETRFVQTLDGDCEMLPGWLEAAAAALDADAELGAAIGRLRERHPERSIYNALCDHEWDGAPGPAPGFGGIAMLRTDALAAAGPYAEAMIAGEDTELAMRMRKSGWRVERLARDMALHDADIRRFGQWWRRARRGGHGFADMAHRHPDARWPNWPRTCRSIIAWGGALPLATLAVLVLAAAWSAWWLLPLVAMLAVWPAKAWQIARAKQREGLPPRLARAVGGFFMLAKPAQFLGLMGFHRDRLSGRASRIIEYKGPA